MASRGGRKVGAPSARLPNRPRQHQLETESRNAFRSAIPSVWVFRDLDQDYGIDGEVEIFEDSGETTGLKFLVQLKATDQILSRALRLRVRDSAAGYYWSLQLPVLIVRFHAPSERIYFRWFHSLDRYYGKKSKDGMSFKLTDADAWDLQAPPRIRRVVNEYLSVKSSRLQLPLMISVSVDDAGILGIPAPGIISFLQRLASTVREVIRFRWDEEGSNSLILSKESLRVRLAGADVFTLHWNNQKLGHSKESLAKDSLLAIALSLDFYGHSTYAATLIAKFAHGSIFVRQLDMAVALASVLGRAGHTSSALEIAAVLFKDDQTVASAQAFTLTFVVNQRDLSDSQLSHGIQFMQFHAQCLEDRGVLRDAAVLRYNCGSTLRVASRYREAIREYRAAARLEPQYLQRSYFWRELAGMLFLNRRFNRAVWAYEKALGLEDEPLVRCLRADAQMFAGKYAIALQAFEEWGPQCDSPADLEWRLKAIALKTLIGVVGLSEQRRFPLAAQEEFQDNDTCEEALADLAGDALSASAWEHLGTCRVDRPTEAGLSLLIVGLIHPQHIPALISASSLLRDVNMDLSCEILSFALLKNREEVSDFLIALGITTEEGSADLSRKLAEIIRVLPALDDKDVLRFHHDDLSFDEIVRYLEKD